MKRFWTLLLTAALVLSLSGCSRAAGGSYALEYITARGIRMSPGSLGMNISLELEKDGTGTASYGGAPLEITWKDNGSEVLVTGPKGELRFSKDGKRLVLHDEGTLLFFAPVEEEED